MPTKQLLGNLPRVSVITCVYNGERFLAQAIESILAQTCADFEYILVDDASTDGSPAIIARYAGQDGRLIALRNPVNLNPSGALNRALQTARGDYLAILDQDDLAHPERLACQAAFLDTHPEVGVVGTQVHRIDQDGKRIDTSSFPTDSGLTRWLILFQTPVLHSAAMMRRQLLIQGNGYSLPHWRLPDYELFTRLIRVTQVTNLPEDLVAYRKNPWQVSSVHGKPQHAQAVLLIYAMLVERFDMRVGLADINRFYNALRAKKMADEAALLRAADLLGTIHGHFMQVEALNNVSRNLVRQDCARRWLVMSWVHRRSYRQASRAILRRALELDPQLWQRPKSRDLLRRSDR
jgi:glycosyltransferase involved in cell wall biosynthesis